MLKTAIPAHKRMAMGGTGNREVSYARGGAVAPIRPMAPPMNKVAPATPIRPMAPADPIRPMAPAMSKAAPETRAPISIAPPDVAMRKGGGVKSPSANANSVKNPLIAARAGNGLPGMKKGGSAGKKC